MYQKNPLLESRNHFFKILSRYTPEERRQIVSRIPKFSDTDEYGRKMLNGQIKRMFNIARKNKNSISITQNPSIDYETFFNGKSISTNIPPSDNYRLRSINLHPTRKLSKKEIKERGLDKKTIRKLRKFNEKFNTDKVSKPLNAANVAAHEADEMGLTLKLMEKHPELNHDDIYLIVRYLQRNTDGHHQLGVLNRENRRQRLLNMIFGKGKIQQIPRSHKSFRTNNSQFDPDLLLQARRYHNL